MPRQIAISIEQQDALTVEGDVLSLKYADAFYGVDEAVSQTLWKQGSIDTRTNMMPEIGHSRLFDTASAIGTDRVLFTGVGYLYDFQYKEIREFARRTLESLAKMVPDAHRIVVTLHGVGYGLDEAEVLKSEVAGFVDAIDADTYPKTLDTIAIVERNFSRVQRLQAVLKEFLPEQSIPVPSSSPSASLEFSQSLSNRLDDVGYRSDSKAHVFVAMPFAKEMEDVYHYGIQGAVRSAGFICERADQSVFTGDIMDWVKKRIESATLVIADLTGANPNVYLEVGYAWGRDRPTVLVVNNSDELKFDVRGQKCIPYENIRNLEYLLEKELKQLKLSDSN